MRRVPRLITDWRTALPLACGAAVLGFGGLYAAGLAHAGDTIADGTRVRGVDIGGMTRTEAQAVLDRELGPEAAAPIALRIDGRAAQAAPAAFGLSLDTRATADRAAQSGSDPFTVIGRLVLPAEKRDLEPVVRTDGAAAAAEAERLAARTRTAPRDGAITFHDGAARATAPAAGVAVQAGAAADAVRTAYLEPRTEPVAVPVVRTQPAVDAGETDRAMAEIAEPAMSGPITLTLAGKPVTLTPEAIGRHLKIGPGNDGVLRPDLDAEGLLADPDVARQIAALTRPSRGAVLEVDPATKRVVVAEDGRSGIKVTAEALQDAVLPLLTRTGAAARTGVLAATEVPPKMTAEEAGRLGIREQVSSFTVEFPAAPYRSTNIARAVELMNGSVVRPGETWSFNRTVGERTEANGFVDGIMINDGRYVKAPGGGVSAVATTMYNAMFFAGLKPLEHGAHSFYIERYPEGREATVAWGTLDLSWRNDSGHAVYVQASSTDTSVTISLLGTKAYDEVRAVTGPRTNVTPPKKISAPGPLCEVQTPLEGFDVAVDRVFVKGGKEVKRETYKTHYTPRDEVSCDPATPSPAPSAPAAPASPAAPAPAPASTAAARAGAA
ncbi:VanW family protein [Streptomyces toxytricini]|uniref:VanW family protein n=1 Tax=Streptomyces toxytricini TaxID=67369 RepID=A0ABW8EMX2_STRT5